MTRPALWFVHEGKANYPELRAYREHLEPEFAVGEIQPARLARPLPARPCVLWYLMGYYPRGRSAAMTIHDYRSLSVGRFARLKDRLKRWRNHRPDLRIFLNAAVEREMGFRDEVPALRIDMGVPPGLPARRSAAPPEYDFVYIGEIAEERGSATLLRAFVDRFQGGKSFVLVGRVADAIRTEFAAAPGVTFTGRLDQDAALDYVARSRVAVCYLPQRRPYTFQTPTKLLEYAALGKPILANPAPSILETAERYGIRIVVGGADAFRGLPDDPEWPVNEAVDPREFEWPQLLESSGIRERIRRRLRLAGTGTARTE